MLKDEEYFKGRGAQINTKNPFLSNEYVQEHIEGIDEPLLSNSKTQYFIEHPKKLINEVKSPDIGLAYSMNPYQGCEHGCIYCYARNSHTYWGFSAGLDFERKIIIKENAPEVLEKDFNRKNRKIMPIMLSGNTDCYQPIEREKQLTRRILELCLKYKHPVSMITKNSLILRDIDILKELAKLNLVVVSISITSLKEELRRTLEPRTVSSKQRLLTVKKISEAGIPVNVMIAPIIPGLNSDEIPEIMKAIADNGASSAAYTMVRLNGQIGELFTDWINQNFPDRAEKVLNQIKAVHGGNLNDSRYSTRMKGEGQIAMAINRLFIISKKKHLEGRSLPPLNCNIFSIPPKGQLSIF